MKINPYVFRNYDIRGIVGEDLDAEKVAAIGKAYGTFCNEEKSAMPWWGTIAG